MVRNFDVKETRDRRAPSAMPTTVSAMSDLMTYAAVMQIEP
jgi:hypothetical protein